MTKISMTESQFRDKYVKLLLSQRGYTERRSNITKYWAKIEPKFQGSAWCGGFVTWGFIELTGVRPAWDHFNSYFTPAIVAYAKKVGAWKTHGPKPGDWCLMNFPGGNFVDHVGGVVDGRQNVEGNTQPGNRGSQSNGGGVYVRTRPASVIAGWVDLIILAKSLGVEFEAEQITPGKGLDVDGEAGPETIKAVQRWLNAERLDRHRRGKSVREWPRVTVDGETGPQTFRAVQAFSGATVDGEDGPETAKSFAVKIGSTNTTGKVFGSRDFVRDLQRHLNALA